MALRRGSTLSLASRVTLVQDDEPLYEDLSNKDLTNALELAIRTNKVLSLENDVFERYLHRFDPQSLVAMNDIVESARHTQKLAAQLAPMNSSVGSLTAVPTATVSLVRDKPIISPGTSIVSGSRRDTSVPLPPPAKAYRITLSHRIEMTNKEIEDIKKSLAELEALTAKRRANIGAHMEEIELRIRETLGATEELEQSVVRQGVDPLTGKIPAEKFVRFMKGWLKAADSIIEKLRLKSSTLKVQIKRAEHHLRQREQLGETLHAIDFQQLAIENQDYMRRIAEKNQYLLDLKKTTGRYNIVLSSYKKRLAEQGTSLESIEKSITTKKLHIGKIEKKYEETKEEVEKAEKRLADITHIMNNYEVPSVLDYVKIQSELREMKKTYKTLERHRKIQISTLKSFKKQREQLENFGTQPTTPLNSRANSKEPQ